MPVCEFDTKINNGLIRVPELYEKEISSEVKVILLYDDKNVSQNPFSTSNTANQNTSTQSHKTLKQRLTEFYGEDYDPNIIREEIKEVGWGKPVGEEIW